MAVRQVSAGELIALMRKALVVVSNGGGTIGEAVTFSMPSIAAALGGSDQPGRIADYSRAGMVHAAQPAVAALVA